MKICNAIATEFQWYTGSKYTLIVINANLCPERGVGSSPNVLTASHISRSKSLK